MDEQKEQPTTNDWVVPGEPDVTAPARPPAARSASRFDGWRSRGLPLACLAAGVLAAGGIGYGIGHHHPSANRATTNITQGIGGMPGAGGFGGPPGGELTAPDQAQGMPGGLQGEQHIQGSLTAKTASSITVKSASGSATYKVLSSTQIVRNGSIATLSDVKVGDPVLVHVYPASGSSDLVVERLFAGSSASETGPGTT